MEQAVIYLKQKFSKYRISFYRRGFRNVKVLHSSQIICAEMDEHVKVSWHTRKQIFLADR